MKGFNNFWQTCKLDVRDNILNKTLSTICIVYSTCMFSFTLSFIKNVTSGKYVSRWKLQGR